MTDPSIHARIHAEIDRRRDEIVACLADLVRIPSVNRNPLGDELAAQRHMERVFRDAGLEVDVFVPDAVPGAVASPGWWPGSDYTDRPNVVGTRRGAGDGRSLLLLAHVDVVPEGPHELWRHGPFNPVVEDGALVGRGAADDKGGLAAQFMALRCLEAAGFRPRGDVILASVVDEESAGANGTLAALHRGHVADGCVYTDGLELEVHIAQLGGVNFDIALQVAPDRAGPTVAHVMELVPAVYAALQDFGERRRAQIAADPRYATTVWPDYALRIFMVQAGSADGGNPGGARILGGAYVLPGESIAAVQDLLRTTVDRAAAPWVANGMVQSPGVAFTGRIMPPSAIDPVDPFVQTVVAATSRGTHRPARVTGMPMSDLFQFLLYSPRPMPTVAIGPGRWATPGGVHEPNESILIDAHLIPFTKILASTIVDWCGVEPAD